MFNLSYGKTHKALCNLSPDDHFHAFTRWEAEVQQELVTCLWPHLKPSIMTPISFLILQDSTPRKSTVGYWNRPEVGLAPQPVSINGGCIITLFRIFAIMYPSGTYLPSSRNKRLAHALRQENNEPLSTFFSVPSFNQTF